MLHFGIELTSPKATVPVLIVGNKVIDESLDIMHWALAQSDPLNWATSLSSEQHAQTSALILENDGEFKHWLDRYKYADRYPQHTDIFYRNQAEKTLQKLEVILSKQAYLISMQPTLADLAVLPFIRQFSNVNVDWFNTAPYPHVLTWRNKLLATPLFLTTMQKYNAWDALHSPVYFPPQ